MRMLIALVALSGLAGCAGGPGATSAASNDPNIRIADAALSSGSPAVALQALNAALRTNQGNAELLERQGRANVMLGNTTAAEISFRRAMAINPKMPAPRLGLAKIIMQKDPVEAGNMFAGLVADNPKDTAALVDLGVALDLQGKHVQAQEAYRKALSLNSSLSSAQQNLGLSLALSGRPEEGAAMLNQLAGNVGDDRKVRDNLAVALTLSGDTSEASKVLREELSAADTARALDAYRALKAPGSPKQP
jgi:Flp pilus assembly protein TadD